MNTYDKSARCVHRILRNTDASFGYTQAHAKAILTKDADIGIRFPEHADKLIKQRTHRIKVFSHSFCSDLLFRNDTIIHKTHTIIHN